MSNEQPPGDDDQDAAEQRRASGRSAFERIADDLNRRGFSTATPAGRMVTEMMGLFNQFERETATARAAEGDTNPYDLDAYADVHDLAEVYDHARTNTADPANLDRFLDNLADELGLADVRALRSAAAAVTEAMGRIALAAREKGMNADRIAAETGYTASRIAQFIREEKQRRAAAPPADQWHAFVTVEEHDGNEWRELTNESVATAEEPTALARRVLSTARESLTADTVRVRVWRFGESEGEHLAEAVHTNTDRMPDAR